MLTLTGINIDFIVPMIKTVLLCGYRESHMSIQMSGEEYEVSTAFQQWSNSQRLSHVCLSSKYQPFCKDMS